MERDGLRREKDEGEQASNKAVTRAWGSAPRLGAHSHIRREVLPGLSSWADWLRWEVAWDGPAPAHSSGTIWTFWDSGTPLGSPRGSVPAFCPLPNRSSGRRLTARGPAAPSSCHLPPLTGLWDAPPHLPKAAAASLPSPPLTAACEPALRSGTGSGDGGQE